MSRSPIQLLLIAGERGPAAGLEQELRAAGGEVDLRYQTAAGIPAGLARLGEDHFDLVLLEAAVGQTPLEEAVAALLGKDPDAVVVALVASEEEAISALEAGAMDVLEPGDLGATHGRRVLRRAFGVRRRLQAARRTAAELYEDLVEGSGDLICTHDLGGNLLTVNRTMVEAYGARSPGDLLGRNLAEFLVPETRSQLPAYLEEIRSRGRASGHMKVLTRDGRERILEYHNVLKQGADCSYVRGTARDVTELRRAEARLRHSEEMLRLFVRHTPAAVAMFDREMSYLAVSDRWRTAYRLDDAELLGRSHFEVFPEEAEHWREVVSRCLETGEEQGDEDPFPRPDGSLDWVRWEVRPWHTSDGEVGGVLMFTENITDRKQVEDALRYLATHDHLTGLLNRASLLDRLERSLERVRKSGGRYGFAVLFLDLDGFKAVNDRYGHGAGDEVLQEVAGRLRDELRPKDAVARFAGDEFVMVVEDVLHVHEATVTAERLVRRLEAPVPLAGTSVSLRASIGIAMSSESLTAQTLLERADAAMYAAKQESGGSWSVDPGE